MNEIKTYCKNTIKKNCTEKNKNFKDSLVFYSKYLLFFIYLQPNQPTLKHKINGAKKVLNFDMKNCGAFFVKHINFSLFFTFLI